MAASETVRVIVRCRPMNQRELDLKCQTIVSLNNQTNQVSLENIEQSNEPPKQFTFDAVYAEDSITENLYAESVFPLVESVLEGYNGTVFAYGQTGCGKSFTMQGINTPGSLQRGVIPRSFEHIFEASAVASGTKYLIRASYLEIYNESIRDLLGKDVKATLDLKEFVDKGVQVQNLSWHSCSSVLDCERLMDKGNRSRATGATSMNKDSSRSHSIFTIVTEMCTRSELDGKEHIRAGKLNLVDLAGSERQSKTHAEGDRLREATRINLSLSALGNVISALVDGRSKHIPYRDSKLTRLLQDSLGGNTKTLMIAAVSPAHDNYDETLSTLRYANRAKNIKNKPRINEDPRDAQMKLLQDEINRLKQELLSNGNPSSRGGGTQVLPPEDIPPQVDREEEIERERQRLRAEFEREVSEIRRQCEAERSTKEEVQRKYEDLKGQYDAELESLTANQNKEEIPPPPVVVPERTRGKKKGGTGKQKRDGEVPTDDPDFDGENSSANGDPIDQKRKLERLQELEHKLVGGEEVNNEERKKKRKKKLIDMKEKQERRKHFHNALNTDDDDTLLKVFDNAQEQLHFTVSKLEEQRVANKRLQIDNEDLEREFQREREGYLNTIREQEKKLLLYRTMIEKMSQVIPRSCNYSNPERIMEQARYEEDKNLYILPEPTREEVQLPHMGNLPSTTTTNSRTIHNDHANSPTANGRMIRNDYVNSPTANGRMIHNDYANPSTPNGRMIHNDYVNPSKANSMPSTTNEYEDDFVVPDEYTSTNYEDAEKRYDDVEKRYDNVEKRYDDVGKRYDDVEKRYDDVEKRYEQNSEIADKKRIKRQEYLLNENLLLQRGKRPLQMNENDHMNRRLNPYDAPARLGRKYGFSSDKQ